MNEVKELLLVLEKNAKSYEQLAETGLQERELLEQGKMEELNKLTMKREELSFYIRSLDAKREEILKTIYKEEKTPSLKELADEKHFLPYRNRILVIRARLRGALEKASSITAYNKTLLRRGVDTIRGAIESSAKVSQECSTYSSSSLLSHKKSAIGGVLSKAL